MTNGARRTLLVPALVVSLLGGCAQDAPREPSAACRAKLEAAGSPSPEPTGRRIVDTRLECGPNEVRVAGAVDARIRGDVILRVAEIIGDDVPKITHFLSVATAELHELADGTTVKVAFDIAPGEYEGDGRYEVTGRPGAVAASPGVTSPLVSNALVQAINARATPPTEVTFDKPLEPCTVRVSRAGSKGSLDCPKLGAPDGREVSVRWTWDTMRTGR